MLSGSTILLTGGTGSFGSAFVPMTLANCNPKKIIVYSRDEMKQWSMAQRFEGDSRVVFFEGNYHDYEIDKIKRLGEEAARPKRIRYRPLTLN